MSDRWKRLREIAGGVPEQRRRLLHARHLYAQGQLPEARAAYAQFIDEATASGDDDAVNRAELGSALLTLGSIDQRLGWTTQAVAAYRQALELTDIPLRALRLVAEQDAQARLATPQAIELYLRYLAQARGDDLFSDPVSDWLRELCRLPDDATPAQSAEVAQLAERVVQANPALAWAHLCHGVALARLGNGLEAQAAFDAAERLAPDDPEPAYQLGALYASWGAALQARNAFRRSLALNPAQPAALCELAHVLIQAPSPTRAATLNDAKAALQLAQQLDARFPPLPQLWQELGQAYVALGDWTLANQAYAAAEQLGTAACGAFVDAEAACARGMAALAANDRPCALQTFARGLELQPNHAQSWFGLGMLWERDGHAAAAASAYERALALDLAHGDPWLRLGVARCKAAQWAAAIQAFDEATRQGRSDDEQHWYRGLAHARLGDHAQALMAWEPLLLRRPDDQELRANLAATHYAIGRAAFVHGDAPGALQPFDRANRLRPDVAEFRNALHATYLALGSAAMISGDDATLTVALPILEFADALAPMDAHTTMLRGLAALQAGDAALAAQLLAPLVGDDLANTTARQALNRRLGLALARLACGDYAAATTLLSNMPERRDPRWEIWALAQAQLALARKQPARAIALLERWRTPPLEVTYTLAWLRAQQGAFDAALDDLAPVLHEPRDPRVAGLAAEVHMRRGLMCATRGEYALAEEELEQALHAAPQLEATRLPLARLYSRRAAACVAAGQDELALDLWQRASVLRPTDPMVLHRLAVACYRQVQAEIPATTEALALASEHWRGVIAGWGALLHSANFWDAQRTVWAAIGMELDDATIAAARSAIKEAVLQALRESAAHARSGADAAEKTEFAILEAQWLAELEVARLLRQRIADGGNASQGFVCGPLMLARLRALPAGHHVAIELEALATGDSPAASRLRRYLAPDGHAALLLDDDRSDFAIAVLEANETPAQSASLVAALLASAEGFALARRWPEALERFERAKVHGATLAPYATIITEVVVQFARQIRDNDRAAGAEAIEVLERGLELLDGQHEICDNLAAIYSERAEDAGWASRYDMAAQFARKALMYAPENQRARRVAGRAVAKMALADAQTPDEERFALLKESYRYDPAPDVGRHLAYILAAQALDAAQDGRYQRSVTLMRESLRYAPEARDASTAAARVVLKSALRAEALKLMQERDFSNAGARLRLARLYGDDYDLIKLHVSALNAEHRYNDAIQLLRDVTRTYRLPPDLQHDFAEVLLAEAAERQRAADQPGATQLILEALDQEPSVIHFNIAAQQLLSTGRSADAVALLTYGLKEFPGEERLQRQLAASMVHRSQALLEQGSTEPAIAMLRQAYTLDDTPEVRSALAAVLTRRARIALGRGMPLAARRDLLEAVALEPAAAETRELLKQVQHA